MNITIIGAGPIGCYAGYLLAKANHNVTIYENHPQIGSPIQCTGLLTSDFDQFNLPKESFLVNTLTKIEVHTPNKKTSIKQKEYLVCRIKFDNFFANLARKAGAKIYVNHSFQRKEGKNIIIKDTKNNKEINITPYIVIGADGPLSPTAKAYNIYHPKRENYYGIQATVLGNFDSNTYQTFFGKETCPGLFAWIVPESATTARVGLATTKNTKYYFDKFMKENNFTAKAMQAGTIPIYHPKQILHKDNCYLIGDASSYVKATTLGGLVPGLKQAQILADCIINNKDFHKEIRPIQKRLQLHLKLHHILNKFSDTDWDRLVDYINQPKIQKILETHTRENPLPILIKALIKEPRFLYFAKYLI